MKKGIGINKNLYYCEEEGEFYWIKQTPKYIFIEWIPHFNCDNSELDQNVRWKELRISKDNFNGIPFYLEPATIEHLEKEIKSCERWGVSSQYYKNLKIFAW